MALKDQINADLKQAMRDKDADRLETIRMLMAAIQRREVDERITLDDEQVLSVVQKLIKQGRDATEQFLQGGRKDLANKENQQIAVLETYLPEPLSDDEVDRLIQEAIASVGASSMKDMGKVIGQLKASLQGRADMGQVSAKVKALLAG
jgi:uncharacterized protein YqeY